MRGWWVSERVSLVVLLGVTAWLAGCAATGGKTYSVNEDAWTEPRVLYRYTVFSPGISHEHIGWSDNEGYNETRFLVGRLRARENVDIAGQTVSAGTKGVGLYTQDGYDLNFYLPPLYRKIVAISPTIAYAQPLDSDTYLRIDLSRGETTQTPYTQVDAVDWSGNWQQRHRFPFFLAEPEPDAPGLMRVTILDLHHKSTATFPRVPMAKQTTDYLGQPLPEIRYLSTRDPDRTGSYMIGGVWPSGERVHRFADASGEPLSPDLKGVTRFKVGNDIKLAVAIEPDLFHPLLDSGVAISPLPTRVLGYKPLKRSDGRPARWGVKWTTPDGPLWSVHKGFGIPWRNAELDPDAYYTAVEAIPSLATGGSAVAVRNHDGSWDVVHLYGTWPIGASTSAQAIAKAQALSREQVRADHAEQRARIAERKQRREQARARAEQARADHQQALIQAFQKAQQRGDNGGMFDAASILGGQYFVTYVLESNTDHVADIQNALHLTRDSTTRAQLQRRLNRLRGSYTSQSGWGTYYEQAIDRSEQSYRENLQRYLRGGNPSDPRVYNLYE